MKNDDKFMGLTKSDQRRVIRITKHVFNVLFPNNFTYDPFFEKEPTFNKTDYQYIYYVSLEDHEKIFEKKPTFLEILNWLSENYDALCISGQYIGYWVDRETHYLDISIAVLGQERAVFIGHENRQRAIFHPSSNNIMYLSDHLSDTG